MKLRAIAAKDSPVVLERTVLSNKHIAPRTSGTPNSKAGSNSGDPEINQQREEKREKRESVRFRAPKEGIHRLSAVALIPESSLKWIKKEETRPRRLDLATT